MKLTNGAAKALARLVPAGHEPHIHLTITDDGGMAQAFVIIEALPVIDACSLQAHNHSPRGADPGKAMSQMDTTKADKKAKKKRSCVDTVVVIVEALLIAIVFRTFLYQPFSIPTASMQSTLMIGDYFVANKFAWGFGKYSFPVPLPLNDRILAFSPSPQRGDVAVFHNEPTGEDYIKRVIGLPGDNIQMKEGRLYINGTDGRARADRRPAVDTDSTSSTVPVTLYNETLPNGVVHTIQEISDDQPLDDTAEYVVPPGHYFMMGDNRDRSADSRVLRQVGYVPADEPHRQGRSALLLDQGQHPAVAGLAVAGQRPLGPHVPIRLHPDHAHPDMSAQEQGARKLEARLGHKLRRPRPAAIAR